jgi:HSP20 family molecular chaperone IbpA
LRDDASPASTALSITSNAGEKRKGTTMPTPTEPRVPHVGTAELCDHLEDALDHWFAGTRGWLPAFDLIRRPSELVLRADVPGVKFDDVRIEVVAATLTISGERPEPDEAEDVTYLREERRCGPFSRSLALPARIDATKSTRGWRTGFSR